MPIFPSINQRCEVEYEARLDDDAILRTIEPYAILRTTRGLLPPIGERVWCLHGSQKRWRWATVETQLADIEDPLGSMHQFRVRLIRDEVDAAEVNRRNPRWDEERK